jgi:hypothetical protein
VSRLERHRDRIEAQLACLEAAVGLIQARPGPVIELGLGKGRSYDHLVERLAGRPIWAFDRTLTCDPRIVRDHGLLVLGDFRETLAGAVERIGGKAVLIHADFGSENPERDRSLAAFLGPALGPVLAPGGILVSDRRLDVADTAALSLPSGIAEGRYFMAKRSERAQAA